VLHCPVAFMCGAQVCARLNLVSLSYMWRQPQRQLYSAMLDAGIKAVLIKVAAMGLQPELHLGKDLQDMQTHLQKLERYAAL
jgi:diphthine-ammonia ligase